MPRKRIGIIGGGRFGISAAEALMRLGAEVLLIDNDREVVNRNADRVTTAVEGDASDMQILRRAGFQECDIVIVGIGTDIEGSVLSVMNVKDLGVPYVVAKAGSETHGKVLERLGVHQVVHPDKERAQRLARSLLAPSAVDFFELSDEVSVAEVKAPPDFFGKKLSDTNLRKTHGAIVLAIKRAPGPDGKSRQVINPAADDIIREGDTLLVFGTNKKLENIA